LRAVGRRFGAGGAGHPTAVRLPSAMTPPQARGIPAFASAPRGAVFGQLVSAVR
jgi:hypothetical protein